MGDSLKRFVIDNFAWRGTVADLDLAGVKALAIAPGSLVDRCRVGGRLLTPGVAIPLEGSRTIEAVRGWRTGIVTPTDTAANSDTPAVALTADGPALPDSLELIGYECGEMPAVGARASHEVFTRTAGVAVPTSGYALALRQNVQGRRGGTIWLRRGDGAASGDPSIFVRALVRLVRYYPRTVCEQVRAGALTGWDATCMSVEQLDAVYTPAAGDASMEAGARVVHWGGQDSWEEADELEVWLGEASASDAEADPNSDWWLLATAHGEI